MKASREHIALLTRVQANLEVAALALNKARQALAVLPSREWTMRSVMDHEIDINHMAATMFDELAGMVVEE